MDDDSLYRCTFLWPEENESGLREHALIHGLMALQSSDKSLPFIFFFAVFHKNGWNVDSMSSHNSTLRHLGRVRIDGKTRPANTN